MSRIGRQWGFTPGEKRAILFVCTALLIGYGYLLYRNQAVSETIPLSHQDSLAIAAIRDACDWHNPENSAESSPGRIIDINCAGQVQFEKLPGIGPVIAARIIEERSRRGGFEKIDDLLEVKGIGPKRLNAIRKMVECQPLKD